MATAWSYTDIDTFEHTCTVKHSECNTQKTLRLNKEGEGEREKGGREGRKEKISLLYLVL